MKFNQLQYLLALEKYKSFSKAARELFVSQPSISVGIRELEEELGFPLLVRNNRGMAFTSEGKRVLEKARIIVEEMENIRHPENYDSRDICGTVNIGGTPHFCNSILLDVMLKVQEQYPNLNLYSVGTDSETIIKRVGNEELQLGIIQLSDVDEVSFFQKEERGEICCGELFSEELCVVAREGHPLTKQKNVGISRLLEYPYATFGSSTNRKMFSLYRQAGKAQKVVRIGEITALRRFLMEYDPITMIPRSAIKSGNDIAYGRLCEIDVPEIDWQSSTVWVYSGSAPSAQTVRVLEILKEYCAAIGR